jgi:hypothetical protein
MPAYRKNLKRKVIILLIIIFSHLLPVIISAFYDRDTHPKYNVKLDELKYWLWTLTWWSAWTSLLTIPWAIYKLFVLKKKSSKFGEQMWDITVAETNFISGVVFCGGGFFLTLHTIFKTPRITYPLLGSTKTVYVWLLYNFFWHVLAPSLTFYYFWKYGQVDKLSKRKKFGLILNLLNSTTYLLYVMLRPSISNFSKPFPSLPRHYPPDYPYPPFFWIRGEYANGKEQRAGQSRFLFWSWRPSWLTGLIWLIIIIIFCYLIFSFLFHFLVKFKAKKDNKSAVEWNKKYAIE